MRSCWALTFAAAPPSGTWGGWPPWHRHRPPPAPASPRERAFPGLRWRGAAAVRPKVVSPVAAAHRPGRGKGSVVPAAVQPPTPAAWVDATVAEPDEPWAAAATAARPGSAALAPAREAWAVPPVREVALASVSRLWVAADWGLPPVPGGSVAPGEPVAAGRPWPAAARGVHAWAAQPAWSATVAARRVEAVTMVEGARAPQALARFGLVGSLPEARPG